VCISRWRRADSNRRHLFQERAGLGECGRGLQPLEDLAGVMQDRCGLGRSGQADETPALAEEHERLLGHDPEPLPAIGRIGVHHA
jgi:hypothetical protein